MFFGLSLIKNPSDGVYATELGVAWLSLQPLVIWFILEQQPGKYDWSPLDKEVHWLQALNLDITMVLVPSNIFGERRKELTETIAEQSASDEYESLASSFTAFMRSPQSKTWQLYPHNDTEPLWVAFVKAAAERYDGDGVEDMPGLKFPVRNWHYVEEYPMPDWDSVDAYIRTLKLTSVAIKEANPQARLILPGLASNYARMFAFADGFIADEDAGMWNGVRLSRLQVTSNAMLQQEKAEYESILREGKGYYDVVDIHLYEEKITFMEGKIDYLYHLMEENNYVVPIWCIEGGGPFKDPPGMETKHGDPYFGSWSAQENAEFVVKMHVLAAAKGLERFHWGLSGTNDDDYWNGPWTVMALMTYDRQKKPAYFAFQLMVQKLNGFTRVQDLSFGTIRLFSFEINEKPVYVAWSEEGEGTFDLSAILGNAALTITPIVTQSASDGQPLIVQPFQTSSLTVPIGTTPVFIETPNPQSILSKTPIPVGDSVRTLMHNGFERSYILHVPPSYDGTHSIAVVLVFHGGGGNAEHAMRLTGFNLVSDQAGFLAVYPNGTGRFRDIFLTWNGGLCCGYAQKINADDVGFVRALIADLQSFANIDTKRIYATGISNGGIMSYRLACEASDLIAAIAPVAGTQNVTRCEPKEPVSIIHFHGTNDNHLPYQGGVGSESLTGVHYTSVADSIQFWLEYNQCPSTPEVENFADIQHLAYSGCASGSAVELYTIIGGGHAWPGSGIPAWRGGDQPTKTIDASRIIWEFFVAHAKP